MLDTYLGQLIVSAAMFDDVLSLILLAMISNASDNTVEGTSVHNSTAASEKEVE